MPYTIEYTQFEPSRLNFTEMKTGTCDSRYHEITYTYPDNVTKGFSVRFPKLSTNEIIEKTYKNKDLIQALVHFDRVEHQGFIEFCKKLRARFIELIIEKNCFGGLIKGKKDEVLAEVRRLMKESKFFFTPIKDDEEDMSRPYSNYLNFLYANDKKKPGEKLSAKIFFGEKAPPSSITNYVGKSMVFTPTVSYSRLTRSDGGSIGMMATVMTARAWKIGEKVTFDPYTGLVDEEDPDLAAYAGVHVKCRDSPKGLCEPYVSEDLVNG